MPGFFITNIKNDNYELKNYCDRKLYKESLENEDFIIKRTSLDSFRDDKIFIEDESYIVITEGVIYNTSELNTKYCCESFKDTLIHLIESKEKFFEEFRGTFSGAVYYKKNNKWVIFTDHLGSHAVYYYNDKDKFIVGSQLNYVTDYMKLNNITTQEDLHGIHCMLDWGYLIDKSTAVSGVSRLYPGEYLEINNTSLEAKLYYIAQYKPYDRSLSQCIEELDDAFNKVIKRIVCKNRECGYKTIMDISGGLDSRMIAYKVRSLFNGNDFIGLTVAQEGSAEQKIAAQVAKNLNMNHLFKMLDTDCFIQYIEDTMFLNNGSSYYLGLLSGINLSDMIDNRTCGIYITGLMGDMKESSMLTEDGLIEPILAEDRYRSSKMFPVGQYSNYSNVKKYFETNEIFWLYLRGIMAGMNTVLARQTYVEMAVPFGDPDFLEVYLSIPWEKRVKELVLLKWMDKKYPEAGRLKYEATRLPAKMTGTKKQRHLSLLLRLMRKIFFAKDKGMFPLKDEMNKKENREYIENYFQDNITRLQCDETVKSKLTKLYLEGTEIEKAVALSVIAVYKIYLN